MWEQMRMDKNLTQLKSKSKNKTNSVAGSENNQQTHFFELNTNIQDGGYKLSSMEIYNWGTFDGQIWKIQADGKGALITGENGSGKSTLVDALLTLLVANNKRNYNLSSGSGRRERSESTYVRGAYGRQMEGLGIAKTKFCRKEEGSYSILLAQFKNYVFSDSITLAQVFWYDRGDLKKIFITSHQDLSIETHFSDFQNSLDLRKKLRHLPRTQIFDTFNDYQMNFMGHFGPKSLKAMDLFNQVVAIKEVGNLSEFVRKHMLEAQSTQELVDQLYMNYENLNLSHQAILQARSQLEILIPIGEASKNIAEQKQKLDEILLEEKKIPLYFSLQRKKNFEELLKKENSELEKLKTELSQIDVELNSLSERKNQYRLSINQNDSSQEIEKLQILIKQNQEKEKQKRQAFANYERLAKELNLSTKSDSKTFLQNKEKLKDLETEYELQQKSYNEQTYQIRKDIDLLKLQLDQYTEDMTYLKKTKGNVPSSLVKLREDLCAHLGVTRTEFPFIAELIQVATSHKKVWNESIEKLLRSFGMRLLVPVDLYAKVNKYLSKNSIGVKLIYNKVDLTEKFQNPNFKYMDSGNLFEKLEFFERSPYVKWLKNQIALDYNFICTDDLAVFQNSTKSIMPSGLIKRGFSLHEKDDRVHLQQGQSLLGWDNTSKLNELQSAYAKTKADLSHAQNHILKLEKNDKEIQDNQNAIRDLSQFKDFSIIDWELIADEIKKLETHQEKLSRGSVSQFQKELDKVIQSEDVLKLKRDQILAEIAVLKSNLLKWPIEIKMCAQIIDQIQKIAFFELEDKDLFKSVEKSLKKKKIDFHTVTTESIIFLQKEITDENLKEKQELELKINTLTMAVLKKMTQFKIKFSESTVDLQASIESLPEFLKLLESLQKESLPEHEKRFRTLLNKSVVNDMAAFKSTLELAYDDITESVEQLNESLKSIPYSSNSHVQLYLNRSKDVEIREFNNMLKTALKVKTSPDGNEKNIGTIDMEESFNQIKKILDRMKKDINWAKNVTDVRNWADFYVLEISNTDGSQKNYYADSSGLSGGQKAKLAFTILASALAFQYGLHKENAADKSFRFVVIDEAFSKSDEKNSRYAMELFMSMGLQLFVVTPKDKIHVVEPYVKNIFLTHINEQLDKSKVMTLTIDEFRKAQ